MNNRFTMEKVLSYFEHHDSLSEEEELAAAEKMFREFVGVVLSDSDHRGVSGDEREGCESNDFVVKYCYRQKH